MYSTKTKLLIVGFIVILLIVAVLIFWFRDKIFNSSGSLGSLKSLSSPQKTTNTTTTTDVVDGH
ncbi:MAG: hypothetical protein [Cotesia congregata filamentous virus 2]